ncbi:hypothetical protein GLOIN_2v1475738 [Rhizophagus irregularis DAOM 181602=DAOM 197198]|nr:hypothetical protein GLOIN_2v1475738 [Rhizophagus irregularis DAOM 181602=DAOM 197198]
MVPDKWNLVPDCRAKAGFETGSFDKVVNNDKKVKQINKNDELICRQQFLKPKGLHPYQGNEGNSWGKE